MKVAFDESLNWEKQNITPESMKILPVNFATEHKQMLAHLATLVSKSYLAVPKQFDKLIISSPHCMGKRTEFRQGKNKLFRQFRRTETCM